MIENTFQFSDAELKQFWKDLQKENQEFYSQLIDNIPDLHYRVTRIFDDYYVQEEKSKSFELLKEAEKYALSKVDKHTIVSIEKFLKNNKIIYSCKYGKIFQENK